MIERHREKFLDWVIIKWHWEQKVSFHQRALSECFALLNFNLKLILILLNLYWCQNQRFPFLESSTGSRNSLAIHEMQRNALVRTHSSWRGRRESCVTKSIAWLQTWILAQLGKRLCQYSIELASCLSQSDHLSCNNVYEWWYLPPS